MQPDLSYFAPFRAETAIFLLGIAWLLLTRTYGAKLESPAIILIAIALSMFWLDRPDSTAVSPNGQFVAMMRGVTPYGDQGAIIYLRRKGSLRSSHIATGPLASGGGWEVKWQDDTHLLPNFCGTACWKKIEGVSLVCQHTASETPRC